MSARIAPGDRRSVGPLAWLAAVIGGRLAGTAPLNLFLVLGRHRRLFRAWFRFAGRMMPRGRLRARETELVILRVAHLRSSAYEWIQHERIGRRRGLDRDDIARIREDPGTAEWTPREGAILVAVDAMHHTGDIDDATWAALREHLDERDCIELCLLAGHYQMLATTITALRIQPEPRR